MSKASPITVLIVSLLTFANMHHSNADHTQIVDGNSTPILKRYKNTKTRKNKRNVVEEKRGSFEKVDIPFGEIEEVFIDTLKEEDEEFGRRLPALLQPLSFEIEFLEPGASINIYIHVFCYNYLMWHTDNPIFVFHFTLVLSNKKICTCRTFV